MISGQYSPKVYIYLHMANSLDANEIDLIEAYKCDHQCLKGIS